MTSRTHRGAPGLIALALLLAGCETPVEPGVARDLPEVPATPPPLALTFTMHPSGGYAGISITPDVEVSIIHPDGTAVQDSVVSVSLALAQSNAILYGTTTAYTTNGVAVFTDLKIDRPGVGYVLVARATGLKEAVSAPFDVLHPVPLTLITPIDNALIRQNDSTIGCPAHPTRGYGFRIRFAWQASEDPATVGYILRAQRRMAQYPIIDRFILSTEYVMRRCNSFVADHNLDGWEWTVTAVDAGWNPVASSPVGLFKFAPCRLADGRSCSAPATPE